MSCCGKGRSQFQTGVRTVPTTSADLTQRPRVDVPAAAARFEYTGTTGLTVRGAITGHYYRFNGSGAQVGVDRRDAPSLMAVPRLRAVR